tara:strand:+ start:2280 stop:2747 length:468 start_codon:yes stop_codon:yes gene_type:complete
MDYTLMKLIHIISAIILLAMGLVGAIYCWQNHEEPDLQVRKLAISSVIRTNWLFVTPALVLQLITGWSLMRSMALGFTTTWLNLTLMLYGVVCILWCAMVWLQISMVNTLKVALSENKDSKLTSYHTYYQYWLYLAVPTLTIVIIIFYLMIFKPA